jgi:protein O-GlcNAc transferase
MTLQQQFEIGLSHHRAARFAEAERVYREILAMQPAHPDALHMLGILSGQRGRLDDAIRLIRAAIAITPNRADMHYDLGVSLQTQRQRTEAISAYRRALELHPNHAAACNNLGVTLKESGQIDQAIAAYRRAIETNPTFAEAYSNLANALMDKRQVDEAIPCYRQSLRLAPHNAATHNNLGNALLLAKRHDEAIASFRRAIEIQPTFADAYGNLANALLALGLPSEAIAAYENAIQLSPLTPRFHIDLGNALRDSGRTEDALKSYREAVRLNPTVAGPHNNVGNALADLGQLDEAIAAFRNAIQLDPNLPQIYCNLGNALRDNRQLDGAIAAYRQALRLQPDFAGAFNNLGTALKDSGDLNGAIESYRRAIRLQPDHADAHSNLIYAMLFHSDCTAPMILDESRRWATQHAKPLKHKIQPHANDRDPDRRLRIGYLSPDFRDHVVGQNLLPLFRAHNHSHFEIFCYFNNVRSDQITEQFRRHADVWHNVSGQPDAHVAELIRQDRLDILVDLTLHMARGRLPVFALKPAPVQVTFAGYPGTTGLDTIDYRLTDPHLDPPGLHDHFYSEKSIHLPETFWCYQPLVTGIHVNPLPAPTRGHLTFGCLNNFCKVNQQVLQLWAQVLKAIDRSRLIVLCPEGIHRQTMLTALRREGIDSDRIECVSPCPRRQYLEIYHHIDIGLDTIPYNGHTTSLDALWMGVPVVTLVGNTVVGRAGLSQLTNLGLTELIVHSPEEYIQAVTSLAIDLPHLADLRRTLRSRMETSPIMDAERFARNVENAYRSVWQTYCARSPA